MKLLTLLACFLGTSLALPGQKTTTAGAGITGDWNGSYGKLTFVFHISKNCNLYESPMDIPNLFPDMNHIFKECETGKLTEYANIQQTVSPVVLEEISSWLKQQVKN